MKNIVLICISLSKSWKNIPTHQMKWLSTCHEQKLTDMFKEKKSLKMKLNTLQIFHE